MPTSHFLPQTRTPGFNTLLRYLNPLVISLACNLEPLIGSLFGCAAGVVSPPGTWTWIGGSLVIASTAVVSLASHRRQQRQASRAAAAAAMQRSLGGGGVEAAAQGESERMSLPLPGSSGIPGRSDSAAEGSWGRLGLQQQEEGDRFAGSSGLTPMPLPSRSRPPNGQA